MRRRALLSVAATAGIGGCLGALTDESEFDEYAWKHETPGRNMVVSDGKVFGGEVFPRDTRRDRLPGEEGEISGGVFSLDARTGEHHWTYGSSDVKESGYRTPIVRDAVYIEKQNDIATWPFAIEFDGTERWSGGSGADTLSGRVSHVVGDVAYLVDRKTVRAIDTASGDELWAVPGSSVQFDTADHAPETAYVAGNELVALDVDDGSVRWRYEHGDAWSDVYAVADGVAYVAIDRESLRAVAAGEERWRVELADRLYDFELADRFLVVRGASQTAVFGAITGEKRWVRETAGEVRVRNDRVYVGDPGRHGKPAVSAFALDDGSERWSRAIGDADQYRWLSVDATDEANAATDHSIFVKTGERELHRVSPAGDVVRTWTAEEELHDFVVDEFVIVSTDAGIYALDWDER